MSHHEQTFLSSLLVRWTCFGLFFLIFFCPWCSAARFERESSAIKCFKTLLYMHCIRHLNGDFKYSALYSVVSNKVHIITMSVFKPQNSQSLNESPWTVTSLKIFDLKRVIVHSRHFWVLYWYVELVLSPFFFFSSISYAVFFTTYWPKNGALHDQKVYWLKLLQRPVNDKKIQGTIFILPWHDQVYGW